MPQRHFFLLCFLPGLDSFGDVPPGTKKDLISVVMEAGGPVEAVQTLLLSDDLLQREAVLAGETGVDQTDPAVLSLQQVKGEEPLPGYLWSGRVDEGASAGGLIEADRIWREYFYYAFRVAHATRTPFLQAWVGFEVGLRNAVAGARAAALKLDPEPYLVAPELGDPEFLRQNLVTDWIAAATPLEALEILDRARWSWITEHEARFSFSDDEVVAYAAKLLLLLRSSRISGGVIESMLI